MEKKRQIAAVLILLALIGVIAYRHSTGKDLEKYEASFFDVFDTQTQIIGYASSKEQFSEQMSLIKDKFQYYNDLYDIYHDYEGMNNIKTINDNAGIQPVKVDEKIIELDVYKRQGNGLSGDGRKCSGNEEPAVLCWVH